MNYRNFHVHLYAMLNSVCIDTAGYQASLQRQRLPDSSGVLHRSRCLRENLLICRRTSRLGAKQTISNEQLAQPSHGRFVGSAEAEARQASDRTELSTGAFTCRWRDCRASSVNLDARTKQAFAWGFRVQKSSCQDSADSCVQVRSPGPSVVDPRWLA